MTSKKELLKRIEILERQIRNVDSPAVFEAKVRQKFLDATQGLREDVSEIARVLSIYKEVLLRSGVISHCEADRMEYQWDGNPYRDKLGRDFHFRINEVVTKKEKTGDVKN